MDLAPTLLASRPPTKADKSTPRKSAKIQKPFHGKQKAPNAVAPSNLSEKKPSDDDEHDEHTHGRDHDHDHKSSTTAKEKPKATAKFKAAKVPEVEAEAVPIPAPDTGLSSIRPAAIHTGVLPPIPSQTPLIGLPHSYGSGFSPLPPLTGVATSTALSATVVPTGTIGGTSRALGQSDDPSGKTANKHLPAVLIVLISIGSAFLLLGGLVFFWRARNRPRKRSCPTPSLPILQDQYADQELKGDEESLFGGKDRSSAVARPNSNGLYPWVQYTPKPTDAPAPYGSKTLLPSPPVDPAVPPPAIMSEKMVTAMAPVHVALPVNEAPTNPPLPQVQNALARAANRVSTLSMSIYPTSPQSTTTHTGIGLAIGGTSPLTADGTSLLQRKPSKERMSKTRKSLRHSLAATEYLDIYGGAQVSSPGPPSDPTTPAVPVKSAMRKSSSTYAHANAQGRARVKTGYTPGATNLRASSTVAGITTIRRAGDRTSMVGQSEEDMQYVLPPLSPALKSDARRERDTRALASALGLASPAPDSGHHFTHASPVPTIMPDDSITLAGDRVRRKNGGHSRAHSEAMSPGTEASARLGNLMLTEFTSMASLPSTRTVAGVQASGSKARVVPRKHVNGGTARTDDRPPRVPSPPPLPSLAQMAMAHTNPGEYEDYRSPTYSIYGLYEAERKSRMQGGEGGF